LNLKNKVIEKSPFKRRQKSIEDEIVRVRPASLVGAAEFLRGQYKKAGIDIGSKYLILKNPETGEVDVSPPEYTRPRPKKRQSKSMNAAEKNAARRTQYQKRRDTEKKRKSAIEPQQVTETKVGVVV